MRQIAMVRVLSENQGNFQATNKHGKTPLKLSEFSRELLSREFMRELKMGRKDELTSSAFRVVEEHHFGTNPYTELTPVELQQISNESTASAERGRPETPTSTQEGNRRRRSNSRSRGPQR